MINRINVISWDDAKAMLPESNPNKMFCDLVSKVCKDLECENKSYVYHIQLEFGDTFIDKGASCFFNDDSIIFVNKIEGVTKNYNDFKQDLKYSNETVDPLGMVLKNHIEIYSENELLNIQGSKYRVHLNSLKAGELFGLFGTLDFLNKDTENGKRDWYAMAGNSCFEILFPFSNSTDYDIITKDTNSNREYINTQIATNIEEKISFFKNYINICNENWATDIIYFPKHFIEAENTELIVELFKIGWSQSKTSRNFLFENKALSDIIDAVDTTSVH